MTDFTLDAYESLLKEFKNSGLPTYGILGHFQNNPQSGYTIRHDVDRKAMNSLLVARLEHKYDIKSTYYFRMTKGSFVPKIISEIASLGHEIGYHYEDLCTARGNADLAYLLFERNLKKLREFAPIKTIAMHGSPLLPWDNRDLWKTKDFKEFGIECEALMSIDYTDSYYITDTGRSWSGSAINLRDHVPCLPTPDIASTQDFVSFISSKKPSKVALVMHPERWTNSQTEWVMQYLKDSSINMAKKGAKVLWSLKKNKASAH